jgi:murein DD-endopeptidase MepM/ murein hydrolase activator NlpD
MSPVLGFESSFFFYPSNTMKRLMPFILVSLVLVGCAPAAVPARSTQVVEVFQNATPGSTITPSSTPTPTLTPTATPTLTPTPTAIPAEISGDPHGWTLLDPIPRSSAACGLVDTLDFPLDPPDGDAARGGQDFGVFRSRYDKYHAGEDWRLTTRDNFGEPVYAIGHGQVTYADGDGWGPDQGVIVIRHVFPDGSTFLSFYGHLDPPSVTLSPGDCVLRGDKIGEIGQPRTPPHLHFEIRTHLPVSTGTGYWSTDPAEAGWLPPSQTIWNTRMSVSPGVLWTRPYHEGTSRALGLQDDSIFIIISGDRLLGIDLADGRVRWSQPLPIATRDVLLEPSSGQLYLIDPMGLLSAYALEDLLDAGITNRDEITITPVWQRQLEVSRRIQLLPRPRGGVIVSAAPRMVAVSPDGKQLWQFDDLPGIFSWVEIDNQLIFTSAGSDHSIWMVDSLGPFRWDLLLSGILMTSGNQTFLYGEDGLYTLDVDNQAGLQVFPLPQALLDDGDTVPLPDGGLMLFHRDRFDRRLIAFDSGGVLQWERSLGELPVGMAYLIPLGERIYLLNQYAVSNTLKISLYAIDPESAALTLIFEGGTRDPSIADTWVFPVGADRLLINIGGGSTVMIDPGAALAIISQ